MAYFRVSQERIERRAQFLRKMGQRHISTPLLQSVGMKFDDAAALTLSEAYYLLSESYKSYRNEPDHRTANPKIAAMTCAAICAINPLRPPAADFGIVEIRFANPMLAMRCATTIIQHPYHMRAFDERRRIYDELAITHFPCLDPYISDVKAGNKKPLENYNTKPDKFSIGISLQEVTKIESFVSRFIVYEQQKIYVSPSVEN